MMTPARLHRLNEEAKQAAQEVAQGAPSNGSLYSQLLLQLAQHKRELKGIQSMERRQQHKKTLMADWLPYIDSVLQHDSGAEDSILAQLFPWCFDSGLIDWALKIGAYMLRHRLHPPENFVRDTASLLAEMAAESWLNSLGDTKPINAAQLEEVHSLTADCDMVDEIRAKLLRALGEAHAEDAPDKALPYLQRAVELNPKVGAKGLLQKLLKQKSF